MPRPLDHAGTAAVARSDEDRFRVRPGKIHGRADAGAKRFTSQVIRAAQKSSAGASGPLSRSRGRGAEKGRGHVAAKMLGGRLGPRARRVTVKARLVVHAQAAAGSTAAHLRYIQRDSATREVSRAGPTRRTGTSRTHRRSRAVSAMTGTSSGSLSRPKTPSDSVTLRRSPVTS